jgi:hypothetical protein
MAEQVAKLTMGQFAYRLRPGSDGPGVWVYVAIVGEVIGICAVGARSPVSSAVSAGPNEYLAPVSL